jgi:hypothetical protein
MPQPGVRDVYKWMLHFFENRVFPEDIPAFYRNMPKHALLRTLFTYHPDLAHRLFKEPGAYTGFLKQFIREADILEIITLVNYRIIPGTGDYVRLILERTGSLLPGSAMHGNLDGNAILASFVEGQPGYELFRFVHLVEPSHADHAIRTMDLLWDAWLRLADHEKHRTDRTTKWILLLSYLAQNKDRLYDETGLARYFLDYFVSVSPGRSVAGISRELNSVVDMPEPVIRFFQAIIAREPGQVSPEEYQLDPVSGENIVRVEDSWETSGEKEENEFTEEIFINNAGMVLLSAYLPNLFSVLKLLEDGQFTDDACREKAIHLLQFAVYGENSAPEYEMVLNKILCGYKTSLPLSREADITPEEVGTVESLLIAMIRNWTAIGSTSVDGFRESFLRREGRLRLKDNGWQLKIEQRGYDILLDQLPWNFSVIKHRWMEHTIYVDWN